VFLTKIKARSSFDFSILKVSVFNHDLNDRSFLSSGNSSLALITPILKFPSSGNKLGDRPFALAGNLSFCPTTFCPAIARSNAKIPIALLNLLD
jgi:hypothetical protein